VTDTDRKAIMDRLQASIAETRSMTREQARARLVAEGYLTSAGELHANYGGKE
jgi:hypothetical protein